MDSKSRLPLGLVDFEQLREGGYVYVDKTAAIWQGIYDTPEKIQYLMSPSGFGKTLTLSVLQAYFEGRSELFKGLGMEQLEAGREEKAWTVRPVLRLDFSSHSFQRLEDYNRFLHVSLFPFEKQYGITPPDSYAPGRLVDLLLAMHESTGHRPAILIDQFDKPVAETFGGSDKELFRYYGAMQKSFYSTLHKYERTYHFVALTTTANLPRRRGWEEEESQQHLQYRAVPRLGITPAEFEAYFSDVLSLKAEDMGISTQELRQRIRKSIGCYLLDNEPPVFNTRLLLEALS